MEMNREQYKTLLYAVHESAGATDNYQTTDTRPPSGPAIIRFGALLGEVHRRIPLAPAAPVRDALADCGWTLRDGRRGLWQHDDDRPVDQVVALVQARWAEHDQAELAEILADPTLAGWERDLLLRGMRSTPPVYELDDVEREFLRS